MPGWHAKGACSPCPIQPLQLQGLIHCCSSFHIGKLLLPGRFVMLLCYFYKVSFLLSKAKCKSVESCASSINFLINKLHQENHSSIILPWHKVSLKKTKTLVMTATDNEKDWTDKQHGLDNLKAVWMWEVCIWLLGRNTFLSASLSFAKLMAKKKIHPCCKPTEVILISLFLMLTAVLFVFTWRNSIKKKREKKIRQSYNNKWDTKQRLKQETKCYSSAWGQTQGKPAF